jgi:hypothetical protein
LTNSDGKKNTSLLNLIDRTSSLIQSNKDAFNSIDYPYLASLLQKTSEDHQSNLQKMAIFGHVMQGLESAINADQD